MSNFLDAISKALGMCGNGRDNNLWVRIADWAFVDCACCIFWRGVALGAIFGALASGVLFFIVK